MATYGAPFGAEIFVQDNDFTRSLWPLYQLHAQKWALPALLVSIDDAMTTGPVVYCHAAGQTALIYETYRPNDRAAVALANDMNILADLQYESDDGVSRVFLASAGSLNYGHFLVDDLPRLKALSSIELADPSDRIEILMLGGGDAINRVRQEAVEAFCSSNVTVRFLDPTKSYRFKRMLYVSPVSSHPVQKHPEALQYVVDTALAALSDADANGANQNLFVVRGRDVRRQLVNRGEVITVMERHGFKVVDPGELGFLDQVRLFANSKITIGQMGAAMTNTMFSKADTNVGYLAASQWIEPFYWDLASARGQFYKVLYGERQHCAIDAFLDNFTVTLDEMDDLLGLLKISQ